jgi:hypothetical protein
MTSQLCWFELPVADVEKGRTFFSDLLGWKLSAWGDESYLTVDGGEPGGALTQGDGRPIVYFAVEDIDAAVARVRELGGSAQDTRDVPTVGRMTACADDQGTTFSLFQPA